MKYLLYLVLFFPLVCNAYPNAEKDLLSLGLSQATGGLNIKSNNRYMYVAYAKTLQQVDLGVFDLTSDQPPDLSLTDSTNAVIDGTIYIPLQNRLYGSQDDGNVLNFDLSNITAVPNVITVASGKTLGMIAADTTNAAPILYVADDSDGLVYVFTPGQTETPSTINLKVGQLQTTSFNVNDMVYVPDAGSAGELYIATSAGVILYVPSGLTEAVAINVDITNKDNFVAIAAMPDGSKVYAVNTKDKTVDVVSTSQHLVTKSIDLSENANLTDIAITTVLDPAGNIYGYVSGQLGLSVFNTSNDLPFDFNTGNTAGTVDPLPISQYGPIAASTDGYVYISSGGGEIAVITDLPYMAFGDNVYKDSSGNVVSSLGIGGSCTMTFQSDTSGTYEIRANGSIDKSGTIIKKSDGTNATGSLTADTDVEITFNYNDNSSALVEGINNIFVFVTGTGTYGASLTGRQADIVNVDTPPPAVIIKSTGFGNEKAYITFERLTVSDMKEYNLYVDTDPVAVRSKTTIAAVVTQPSSGSHVTGSISGLANGSTYYLAVEGVDLAGNIGTRTYLLPDGSPASAIPQLTVGPAKLSGETGGCSLVKGSNNVGAGLFIMSLLAVIAARLCRSKKVFIAICVVMLSFVSTSLFAEDYSIQGGNAGSALTQTPQLPQPNQPLQPQAKKEGKKYKELWSTEFRVGFWMPTNSTTKLFFSKCCNIVYQIGGGFLYDGKYGVETNVGLLSKNGNALGLVTGAVSSDTFNFFMIPMDTSAVWRIDYANPQYVAPYIKGGFDYVFYRDSTGGSVVKGLKTGLHATAGIQLSLADLTGDKFLGDDYSVNDVCFTMEARYNWINSFGKSGLNLSGMVYSAGFLFKF